MSVELLAPAGNREKLQMALHYGADAVYLGGQAYGLRAYAGNFAGESLIEAIQYTHQQGKKAYVTVNIFAHNRDLDGLPEYLEQLAAAQADGIIVADPGVVAIAKRTVPDLPIHLSTQANVTNAAAARFWAEQGVKRIVLARELSIEEIRQIRQAVDIELEVFIHGAMCMSYSGRCLISDYLTGRQANKGECAQACRWRYGLVEEKRPDMVFPIEEDERGSYIFNASDLCLLEAIPELCEAGVNSMKIEGRMKSVHYVATVARVYRQALDRYLQKGSKRISPEWWDELTKISHRQYTTGFLYGRPGQDTEKTEQREYDFVGLVQDYNPVTKQATIEVRNRIVSGDLLEIVGPSNPPFLLIAHEMVDQETGEVIEKAPRPHQRIQLKVRRPVQPFDLVRRPKAGGEESFIQVAVDRAHIFYLDIFLEGFGHLGVPTTVDKEAGLLLIRTTPDTREEVLRILRTLPWPVQIFGDNVTIGETVE
ncbi:U32 family peptidase C-terminal domain-containing protein [Heliophilum fasciatum]|uniref:Putative protease n=1 Tax=Heliophilum fasciatum TaxID=35700 RepID=A0A4R2RZ11_9FIRM|nr:U32 family peptidase C-terminal domain-containing protein [Heliophilum fasciatum]MCW2278035.1 putative protease [Heliophilum fasciatum]TCP64345.1 putative protease [Heliophilum fasciatum]